MDILLHIGNEIIFEADKREGLQYQMYSVITTNTDQVKLLQRLNRYQPGVKFLSEPNIGRTAVVVAPDGIEHFLFETKGAGMKTELLHHNVQSLVDATIQSSERDYLTRQKRSEDQTSGVINSHKYHNYSEILAMLYALSTIYPNIMELDTLEYETHEGRQIALVKLQVNRAENLTKPLIIIEAGIHAREWIAPAVALWLIDTILEGYRNNDANITLMLEEFDWYIIPVMNPDGYEYSHTTDRMWRKNRRPTGYGCFGVDINRNFDVAYNTTGVSNDRCDDVYPGGSAFSEPESASIRDLVLSNKNRLAAYVSLHSFSQSLLVPWGYAEDLIAKPDNFFELNRIAQMMSTSIQSRYGTDYSSGQAFDLIGYAASGASEDWVLDSVPGIFSICIELRPNSDDPKMFLLPPEEIIPSSEEYFDGLVAMVKELAR